MNVLRTQTPHHKQPISSKMKKPSFVLLLFMISTGLSAQENGIVNRHLDTCFVDLFSYNYHNYPIHPSGGAVLYYLDVNQDGENDLVIDFELGWLPETPLGFDVFPDIPIYPPKWEVAYLSDTQVNLASVTTYKPFSGHFIDMKLSDHIYDTLDYFRFGIRHAIEIDDLGQTHYCYGWIKGRIRAQRDGEHTFPNNTLCLDRFVYCTIPDFPLQWGQTCLTETTPKDLIELYPNPTQDLSLIHI